MSWIKVLDQDALPQEARQVVKIGSRSILLINHQTLPKRVLRP